MGGGGRRCQGVGGGGRGRGARGHARAARRRDAVDVVHGLHLRAGTGWQGAARRLRRASLAASAVGCFGELSDEAETGETTSAWLKDSSKNLTRYTD